MISAAARALVAELGIDEDHADKVVADAPDLSDAQLAALRALMFANETTVNATNGRPRQAAAANSDNEVRSRVRASE
jgi:hypothetical protein